MANVALFFRSPYVNRWATTPRTPYWLRGASSNCRRPSRAKAIARARWLPSTWLPGNKAAREAVWSSPSCSRELPTSWPACVDRAPKEGETSLKKTLSCSWLGLTFELPRVKTDPMLAACDHFEIVPRSKANQPIHIPAINDWFSFVWWLRQLEIVQCSKVLSDSAQCQTSEFVQEIDLKLTAILQIFGALKFRWRATAERSV